MKIEILAFSAKGAALGERIAAFLTGRGDRVQVTRCGSGGLGEWTERYFSAADALIFVGSCGIAVRAVASQLKSKLTDPAVVVVDECAAFCVSLLSGHLGGANTLTETLAGFLDAVPVITTATDRNRLFAVDRWAKEQGLFIANPKRIKDVSSRLLAGEEIRLGSGADIQGTPLPGVVLCREGGDVVVSPYCCPGETALHLVPPMLTLGVGCRKGTGADALERCFTLLLERANCHPAAVGEVCTIELKANEPGLLAFCRSRGLPLKAFTAEQLAAAEGRFSGSEFVRTVTGVDNVCERSAALGSGGALVCEKTVLDGVTMALAARSYPITFEG